MNYPIKFFLILVLIFSQYACHSQYSDSNGFKKVSESNETIKDMLTLLIGDEQKNLEILRDFNKNWDEGYIPMLLDVVYFSRGQVDSKPIIHLLEKRRVKNMAMTYLNGWNGCGIRNQKFFNIKEIGWRESIKKLILNLNDILKIEPIKV